MGDGTKPQLIRQTKESYGDSFKADLFAQYTHYVESAEKISERRVVANNYLLTVNALLVTLYGVIAASKYHTYWTILVPVAGLLVAVTWHRIITSYRGLNTVKFKVIHELEQHMPAAIYDYEWDTAQRGKGKVYHPLSHLEQWIPLVFIILYIVLAVVGGLGLVPEGKPIDVTKPESAATAPAENAP
ncbi:MAG: hypothetical protein L0219_04220 [Phycisphaerales bacterium]|nr:hypothetical protein [Phycisphaerales bacterium]MCI0675596.1 hypothetical protein [Phycisphaerales bacterium]